MQTKYLKKKNPLHNYSLFGRGQIMCTPQAQKLGGRMGLNYACKLLIFQSNIEGIGIPLGQGKSVPLSLHPSMVNFCVV